MEVYWSGTAITFFPVLFKDVNGKMLGEFKVPTELTYLEESYKFEHGPKSILKAFTANKIRVLNNGNEAVAAVNDPQWLKPIEIKENSGNSYTIVPKLSFGENFSIRSAGKKIGEFSEKFFAKAPTGKLVLNETYSGDITLIATVLYVCLYKRMLTS